MLDSADVTPEPVEAAINYRFQNRALLEEALTHASLVRQQGSRRRSNQRLEFLGDAVLQLVLTDLLFRRCGEKNEGALTSMRAQMVSTAALAVQARMLELGRYLKMDPGEENNGGRERESILADALEAVLGAMYLDGGLEGCQPFVQRLFGSELLRFETGHANDEANPKGRLQELLQGINQATPVYQLLEAVGPDHNRLFQVVVIWEGLELGRGSGRSKKEAETAAAREALATKRYARKGAGEPR